MNSSCHEIEILLTGYAAGELDSESNEAVRLHLAGCADCRAELRRELQLRELMGSLPTRHLALEVADLACGDTARPGAGAVLRRWLAPAAALAAVLALVLLAGRFAPWPSPGPAPIPRAEAPATDSSESRWTEQELDHAHNQVEYTLALTARLLAHGEQSALQEVFGDRLPRAITDSLRKSIAINEGDQG